MGVFLINLKRELSKSLDHVHICNIDVRLTIFIQETFSKFQSYSLGLFIDIVRQIKVTHSCWFSIYSDLSDCGSYD